MINTFGVVRKKQNSVLRYELTVKIHNIHSKHLGPAVTAQYDMSLRKKQFGV